ncbi:MAG: capsule assembly Wzi family protein [Nitrospirota bacterium]
MKGKGVSRRSISRLCSAVIVALLSVLLPLCLPSLSWGLASSNIPLDSPIYTYLDKLSGFGLINSDIHGLKPYSKAEAARLVLEAEGNLKKIGPDAPELAQEIISRLRYLLPRELDLYNQEDKVPLFDVNPLSSARFRYVYLDGVPRSYDRLITDTGHQGVFGIGDLRKYFVPIIRAGGSEGTPLLENNEGIVYKEHNNFELRTDSEFYLTRYCSALVEPLALVSGINVGGPGPDEKLVINKGYVKLGGHGLELEVGKDENWFGQGYRGDTVMTDNAENLEEIKLSSPEPVDWPWFKRNFGLLKYAVIFSRLTKSGEGKDLREPWFAAGKISLKPTPNLEIGVNYSRQQGGPNVIEPGLLKSIFSVGQTNNGSNSLAGTEIRYRFNWLRGTTVYWEYYGEDSYVVIPIVDSHLAGIYVPRLTADGRNDFRFEFFYGNPIAYTDYKFPEGYTNNGLIMGDSQGGDTKDYFGKFTHYFTLRNTLSLEYFHTQRGWVGRAGGQAAEDIDGGRIFWSLPLSRDWDALLNYGYEYVRNFNLNPGNDRQDNLLRLDISYRY